MSQTEGAADQKADEYVLGLLPPALQAEVEADIERDPTLRTAVAMSRDRFLELDLLAKPVTDAAELWDRIEATLRQLPVTRAESAVETSAPPKVGPSAIVAPANDNAILRWRMTALGGLAASLLLAAGLGWTLMSSQQPLVVAVLQNESGEPLALVEDFGDASTRVTPLTDFVVPVGQTLQVWTLPSQEMGPVSLGLLQSSQTVVLDGPTLPQPQAEQLYEITVEQEGGSPTGRPTGPILVKGFARQPR